MVCAIGEFALRILSHVRCGGTGHYVHDYFSVPPSENYASGSSYGGSNNLSTSNYGKGNYSTT